MIDKLNFFKGKIKEYIKFNIIGTSNFIVSQIFYITLFLVFNLNYIIAYTITSILSVIASYFLNSKFTFKISNKIQFYNWGQSVPIGRTIEFIVRGVYS